jgi:hypothetical protein
LFAYRLLRFVLLILLGIAHETLLWRFAPHGQWKRGNIVPMA